MTRVQVRSRFAPSTTGRAHPGTLLAALLSWLDCRSQDGHFVLRFEDLDPQRCKPELQAGLREDLLWFGLDWDEESTQSQAADQHRRALETLIDQGHAFACACSRTQVKKVARQGMDGSWVYPGTCRDLNLPIAGHALRCRLPETEVQWQDECCGACSIALGNDLGDPIIRRRDGALAYHLASVVDDAAAGINRIVRGQDLLAGTAIQWCLRDYLGYEHPGYLHHGLLLERGQEKYAKFHQSVSVPTLKKVYAAEELCGILAAAVGLLPEPQPVKPAELLSAFHWSRVESGHQVLHWDGQQLSHKGGGVL